MFVSDKLVYLQLQKTASTHIAQILTEHVGGSYVQKHARLDPEFNDRYIIGSIRNPFDWYVSLWAHGCRARGNLVQNLKKRHHFGYRLKTLMRNPFRIGNFVSGATSGFGKPISLWNNAYSDAHDPEKFKQWIKMLLAPERKYDMCEGFAESQLYRFAGYMTHRYLRLYSKDLEWMHRRPFESLTSLKEYDDQHNVVNQFVRVESLEEDLLDILKRVGIEMSDAQSQRVLNMGRTNASKHGTIEKYYDDETRDLVLRRDEFLFEKHYSNATSSRSPLSRS